MVRETLKILHLQSCLYELVQYPYQPFKRQHHEKVKHTQTICRLLPTNCSSVLDNFVGLALKGLRILKFYVTFNLIGRCWYGYVTARRKK